MTFDLEPLELTEMYEFGVTVNSGSGMYYGKLYLR